MFSIFKKNKVVTFEEYYFTSLKSKGHFPNLTEVNFLLEEDNEKQ